VTEPNGTINEDGFGYLGDPNDVAAAWVFDGVTGINTVKLLEAPSDAAWLVARTHHHLLDLAKRTIPLPDILAQLVARLISDWNEATARLDVPADYDPPAACLILVKRYGGQWKALRLGDSCLMARSSGRDHQVFAASPNNVFDNWLSAGARKRRDAGVLDIKALLTEFRPQLIAARQKRNTPDGYSILECNKASLAMPEYIDLGSPEDILLCTDGYYRAVDHYGLFDDEGLLNASRAGVSGVMAAVRSAEAADPACERYLRFKPADDATAVMLTSQPKGE
jgi:hypothetical protein